MVRPLVKDLPPPKREVFGPSEEDEESPYRD
jgi:hypothetical protein